MAREMAISISFLEQNTRNGYKTDTDLAETKVASTNIYVIPGQRVIIIAPLITGNRAPQRNS